MAIKIDSYTWAGYAFCIVGNGGEEQLTIVASWGQDGSCRYKAIAASVDGAVDEVSEGCRTGTFMQVALWALVVDWVGGDLPGHVLDALWKEFEAQE